MDTGAKLNTAQNQAVNHRDGPLIVVAGAGAGKTRTIVYRIANLIRTGIKPEQILAVTFTNKAAGEMLKRVIALCSHPAQHPLISTFHTLGASILRDNAGVVGLNRHFGIADQDDSLALIKTATKEAGLEPKQFSPRQILHRISRLKGRGITLKRYRDNITTEDEFWARIILPIWERYEKKLRARSALDFDDLLLWPVELLEKKPEILARYRARWHYLLIDEYQDTNHIQYHLARLLAGKRKNICVVGDLDQAIYSWRGADCRHLLRFAADYPGATTITLEENYRSTQAILTAANQIIDKNVNRVGKTLFTRRAEGEKIALFAATDERQEAAMVAAQTAQLIRDDTPADEIAVLYRANFQSRVLEEAMLRANVPYRVLGTRFFERKEVKDVLAYLKAALNPPDLESFHRALDAPARGLGKVALTKILAGADDSLPERQQQKLKTFRQLLAEIADLTTRQPVSSTLRHILRASGLSEILAAGGEDDQERLENIQELVSVALKYDSLPPAESAAALLAEAALVSDQDTLDRKRELAVNLMTVHAAKGLEFNQVFIVGLEQSLFPHERFSTDANTDDSDSDHDEEEERRLFYVALTRARDKLYLSYAETRTIYGGARFNQPSEFLLELAPELLETHLEALPPSG